MKRIAPNLYQRKLPGRRGSWIFRYQFEGRARAMSLGPLALVSVAKAKADALKHRAALHEGVDPAEARARPSGIPSFDEVAAKYIEAQEKGWKAGGKSAAQWRSSMKAYASPVIGRKAVDKITAAMVAEILEPIWLDKAETARRVRHGVAKVLSYAVAKGWRHGANPASRERLQDMLPKVQREIRHHVALDYLEVPALVAELRTRKNVSARALLFACLTVARTSEVLGMTWDELDMTAKLWRVPAGRMKAAREHVIPLTLEALETLRGSPEAGELMFPGPKGRLSQMALLEQMRGLRPGRTVHGLRASFKTWAAERTDFPREIVEACLAHSPGKLERAYQRGELLANRREVLAAWARHCCGVTARPVAGLAGIVV
jgi:integrase